MVARLHEQCGGTAIASWQDRDISWCRRSCRQRKFDGTMTSRVRCVRLSPRWSELGSRMEIEDALVVFAVTVAGVLAVQYVAYRWTFAGIRGGRFQLGKNVGLTVLLGIVVVLATQLYPGRSIWAVVALMLVVLVVTRLRDGLSWRRFFGELDAVCIGDESRAETFLGLRHPPVGRAARARWCTRILFASNRAHELDRSERALRWVDALEGHPLPPNTRLSLTFYRAALSLSLGQREAARAALERIPARLPSADMEEAAAANRMLLAILDGNSPPRALLEVRARLGRKTRYADAWSAIEAHLLAAQGDEQAARATLRELRGRSGEVVIKRVARHDGPASTMALRLDDAPYR